MCAVYSLRYLRVPCLCWVWPFPVIFPHRRHIERRNLPPATRFVDTLSSVGVSEQVSSSSTSISSVSLASGSPAATSSSRTHSLAGRAPLTCPSGTVVMCRHSGHPIVLPRPEHTVVGSDLNTECRERVTRQLSQKLWWHCSSRGHRDPLLKIR